jgi:hypothetical protein
MLTVVRDGDLRQSRVGCEVHICAWLEPDPHPSQRTTRAQRRPKATMSEINKPDILQIQDDPNLGSNPAGLLN